MEESYDDPVRYLAGVEWGNLPDIKPVGEDPVTVTPTFYLGGEAVANTDAELSLDFEIDVAELDLRFNLAPGLTPTLAGIGPIYTYDKELGEWNLGTMFGNDYGIEDSDGTLYKDLGAFIFPLAPNPVPTSGLDRVQFLYGSDDYVIEQVRVNLDPGNVGKEFFNYVLEDADGNRLRCTGTRFADRQRPRARGPDGTACPSSHAHRRAGRGARRS